MDLPLVHFRAKGSLSRPGGIYARQFPGPEGAQLDFEAPPRARSLDASSDRRCIAAYHRHMGGRVAFAFRLDE